MELRYSILDPTGNITALVESPANPDPAVAAAIMRRHPEVEQVGFLRPAEDGGLPRLQMAGGEFCGNASMCAAALLLTGSAQSGETRLRLQVSGVSAPVELCLRETAPGNYEAEITMPPAVEIQERPFSFEKLHGSLPLVKMQGIEHLIVEETSPFFTLSKDKPAAERAVRNFCAALGADCLGLLFLAGEGSTLAMTPLVFVPCGETVFWENSCASGSAAVGMYLARKSAAPVELTLREPGGILRVRSTADGETRLHGRARLVASYRETL